MKKVDGNFVDYILGLITGHTYSEVETLSGAQLNEEGYLTIDHLDWGTYKLVETKAKDGYSLLDNDGNVVETEEFTIDRNSSKVIELTTDGNTITNNQTVISINKVDNNNNAVIGAHLQILDSEGNIVDDFITTDDTYVLTGKLIYGESYTLHEVNPPLGYERAEDQTFIVDQTNITITMIDKNITASNEKPDLILYKTDQDRNFLLGATFRLVGEGRDETIESDARFVFTQLDDGHYTIYETVVPEGYEGIESFEIDVYEGHIYYEYNMTDSFIVMNSNDDTQSVVDVLGANASDTMEKEYLDWVDVDVLGNEIDIDSQKDSTHTKTKTHTNTKTSDDTNIIIYTITSLSSLILIIYFFIKKKTI
jgi:uncharacterized surface anchored protein